MFEGEVLIDEGVLERGVLSTKSTNPGSNSRSARSLNPSPRRIAR